MKNLLRIVLCVVTILVTGCSSLHKSDSTALQGTWMGQEINGRAEGVCRLIISGDDLEFRSADSNEWYKGTFTLREDARPKQLVGVIKDCPAPQYIDKTVCAIYKLEAGTLTLTGDEPGNPNVPSGFDAPGARKFVLKKQ
jgi:uncharacterized protein (TIGR03067 family)